MSDVLLIAGAACFAVFAIFSVYAALRGKNVLLSGMLVCLVGAGAASIYGIHLQSVEIPELEQSAFVAVDISEYRAASDEPESEDDDAQPSDNSLLGTLLALVGTVAPTTPSEPQPEPESGAAPNAQPDSDTPPDSGASDGLGTEVRTVTHTEDSADGGVPFSAPIMGYVMSDLSDTGGISPIEWEDRLRYEHLAVIEKRYRELLESQR